MQTAPNATDDSQLLAEALPNLKKRTGVHTIHTDGGHGGPISDIVLREKQVEHIQTAIRGRIPNPQKLHLSDFVLKFNPEGKPLKATCPQGQTISVQSSSHKKAFVAHFDADACAACPFAEICTTQPGKRDPRRHLRFTQAQAHAADRRRRTCEQQQEGRNLRAAVEATIRSLKHPFPAGKLPVRGQFRIGCMLIGSAAMTNIRRIHRCLKARIEIDQQSKVLKANRTVLAMQNGS